jgi:hypothetical protein
MSLTADPLLHTFCLSCAYPLHIAIGRFLRAEGTHRCPWCAALLFADGPQLHLLAGALRYRDWDDWARACPARVVYVDAAHVLIERFGALHIAGEAQDR